MPPQRHETEACGAESASEEQIQSTTCANRTVPLVELELENVTYSPVQKTAKDSSNKTRKVVLDNVSTAVSPFQLSAWMGPSGSGKTSLITVAAGLTKPGDVQEGTVIKVNGEEGSVPKRLVGVVWQDDLLLSNLTVEETIYFAARLKTPANTPVHKVVEETMQELGLTHIRDSLIGSATVRGISGGERKRVSVASELVVRPSLLFLDEPTSGLDATSAQALMQTLKDLAMIGHAIAVVIHQPRTAIYSMFDNVLLLSRGRVVYNGKACWARAHLESCNQVEKLPPETGIADWIMDVIKNDEENDGVLPTYWNESKTDECSEQISAIPPEKLLRRKSSLAELRAIPKFETSFWMQLVLLTKRTLKQQRGEKVTKVSLLLTLTYIISTGFFWWRLPDDTSSIYNRSSLLFFMLIAQANGIVIASVNTFQRERSLLARERAKKMYGVLPFFLAKTASDMTNNVLLPVVYGMVSYWIANLRPTAAAFFQFVLAFYVTLSTAQSMGLFLSIAIPSMQIALILAPPITLFFVLMGGFYIPFESMNVFIQWISWLSFARYGYSSFLINEFEGRVVPCSEDDDVVMYIGGTDKECPASGDAIIAGLGISGVAANFWFNVVIVLLMQIVFRVASYVLLRRSK
jgi:ABC-type multidrug transport system ATPase subunit